MPRPHAHTANGVSCLGFCLRPESTEEALGSRGKSGNLRAQPQLMCGVQVAPESDSSDDDDDADDYRTGNDDCGKQERLLCYILRTAPHE